MHLLQQRQAEDALRLEQLRGAAQVGFGALDRGEYVELDDERSLLAHIAAIGRAVRTRATDAQP